MNLRTPKRYRKAGRRRLFSLRWCWLYLLTPVVVVIGAGIWQIRDMLRPPIEQALANQLRVVEEQLATRQAPTPTATDSPVNYLAIANAAYQRGAMEEAIENYALAAEGMPNDVALHFRLAHLMITNEQEEEALAVAEKAINADPYSPLGWAIRGMALDWTDQYGRAIASLLRALELDPNSAVAHAFLAETYTDMGEVERAFQAAERALELDPTDFNVQRNYGYVLQWGYGDFEGAIDYYERALQLEPSRAYIAFSLADLYYRNQDIQAEIDLLRQVIDRNPENATAHYRLAVALVRDLGEYEQAREVLERCTAIAPEKVSCLSLLGALQLREGEYNLCARTLERAVRAGSRSAQDYLYAGICYTVIDDCRRAVELLRIGLGLAEDDLAMQYDIRDALAQCQVIVTLEPTPTLEGETPLEPELEATPTPS